MSVVKSAVATAATAATAAVILAVVHAVRPGDACLHEKHMSKCGAQLDAQHISGAGCPWTVCMSTHTPVHMLVHTDKAYIPMNRKAIAS